MFASTREQRVQRIRVVVLVLSVGMRERAEGRVTEGTGGREIASRARAARTTPSSDREGGRDCFSALIPRSSLSRRISEWLVAIYLVYLRLPWRLFRPGNPVRRAHPSDPAGRGHPSPKSHRSHP